MDIEAKVYNATNSSQSKAGIELIDRIKCENQNKKFDIILDIGCGTGNVTQMLTELLDVKQVFALDIKENLIDFAKQNYNKKNITYLIQDFSLDWDKLSPEIRSLKGQVSLVFSNFCLHWIKERENLGKNIRNLLSSNGKFYATIFSVPDIYYDLNPEEKLNIQDFVNIPTEGEQVEAWLNTFQLNETNENSIKIHQRIETVELKAFEECYINALLKVLSSYFTSITNLSNKERIDVLIRRYMYKNYKSFIDQNTGKEMIDMWYNYFEFGLINTNHKIIGTYKLEAQSLELAGTVIIIHSYDVHTNPDYWSDPLKFKPESFLNHTTAFLPFSDGPRNFIGYQSGLSELRICLAKMVKGFEFNLAPDFDKLDFFIGNVLDNPKSVKLNIQDR